LEDPEKLENPKKRPAEEASPVITPPPNLRDRSPPPPYKSGYISLNDYNEESAEVADTSTEASPVMFFFVLFVV
jgi:hypothetical protein